MSENKPLPDHQNRNPREGQPSIPLLVTRREAASLLNIGVRTLDFLMREGELPAVRIGKAVRLRTRDLEDYCASKAGRPMA